MDTKTRSSRDTEPQHIELEPYSTVLEKEPAIVVMPLDNSDHSDYCLEFYLKYLHKPENKVYVIYVSEPVMSPGTISIASLDSEGKDRSCCKWPQKLFGDDSSTKRGVNPSPGVMQELERKDWAKCKSLRTKVRRCFHTNSVTYEFRRVMDSDPCRAIKAVRKEVDGTLIVMGSRGQGPFKRTVFGSVSEKVLHESLVPVLVVKKPKAHRASIS